METTLQEIKPAVKVQYTVCPVCKQKVSLNVSWYDPYIGNGSQVHFSCLSEERKREISD